jgi:hypothetical protein
MSTGTYRVVSQGLQPGFSAEVAGELVAALFKCSREQVDALVGETPVTVRKGLAYEAAEKYARALERCGCACVLEQERGTAPAVALMTLSEERLYRIQPKLFDLKRWANQADRDSWREAIRDTLARGDNRAAVVVDAASSVVAAYTNELDCVVLLQFDTALGLVHGWQNGTRLLSANSYFARDTGVAPDLQPGPGDRGRWGNVWPLIADLLTDDQARLSARKQQIDADEWERAWQLGRSALADAVPPRDGRPLGSRKPAARQAVPSPTLTAGPPTGWRFRRTR